MPDVINLLPDSLANQIAAGEVVQRPASVVKELLENSIDAKGENIILVVKDAGKSLIQIIDDGAGMSDTDARMSFERHATSKIQSTEDLFNIRTMGFRGEALASVAAVSKVELKTKMKDLELGSQLIIEASEFKKQEPISTPKGSSISVKNLFYNVPARRNFLKSNPVEMRHIIDEFKRAALSRPEIAFTMFQNDNEIYKLSAGKLSQRIVGIFGKNYRQQLVVCNEETDHVKIYGYVGKPELSRKTRGEQFFFINNRFIKNNYLNHAVTGAYEGLLQEGYFPFYVLYIELDPAHIDINVHPTKTEVKFDDERTIYGIVKSAVKQALGTHNVTPSLDFTTDVNFESLAVSNLNFDRTSKSDRNYGSFKSVEGKRSHGVQWEKLYESAINESVTNPETIQREEMSSQRHLTFDSAANESKSTARADESEGISGQAICLMHHKYLIKQVKSGMMLLDVHLAYERILYEKYIAMLKNKSGASQRCLFPQTLDLNPSDYSLVIELESEIRALGFDFDVFGKNVIVINGVPAEFPNSGEQDLLEGLIEQFKFNKAELSIGSEENMARSMAKRASSRMNIVNNPVELSTLIDRLFACKQPNYTPDGMPTFVVLNLEQLAEFFNR